MAGKRHSFVDYAEDSYTDEEDEIGAQDMIDEQQEIRHNRPGRPRRSSTTMSSTEGPSATFQGASGVRRRGRGPAKRPCLNRNALMARENRQRKKEYIERIERKLQHYQDEHQELNDTIQKQSLEIKKLTQEVAYLKAVLGNKTAITSLLKAINGSLKKTSPVKDDNDSPPTTMKENAKSNADVANWIVSGQTSSSKQNSQSVPASGLMVNMEEEKKVTPRQVINPTKIARKTLPLNPCIMPKTENTPSNQCFLEEDEPNFVQKSSPQSGYSEYTINKSPMEFDNQLPTTSTSTLSNSMDQGEASLSDTDFSQLSSFNLDFFETLEKIDEVPNPLQFEQDTPDLFNEDTLFHSMKETDIQNNDIISPLEINQMSDTLNEKSWLQNLENTGVCLHVNSNRVSLEYCSSCYLNSLNPETL